MKVFKKILLAILILIIGFAIGFFTNKLLNTDKQTTKKDTETNTIITEKEALDIAKSTYKNTYSKIGDGNEVLNYTTSSINTQAAKTYFTEEFIKQLTEYSKNNDYIALESYFLSSILGVTDQSLRDLSIISYNNDTIVAKGKNDCEKLCGTDEFCACGETDFYHYIILKKINNNWLIDYFN